MVFFAKIMPLQGESLKTLTIPKKSAVILFVKERRFVWGWCHFEKNNV
jgi:hypothetical protein